MLIGFGMKAGIVPLHIWLLYAHPMAPSHISVLMSAVMIKMGIYGLFRVYLDFLDVIFTPAKGVNTLFLSTLIGQDFKKR